jgi:hypothetical protein
MDLGDYLDLFLTPFSADPDAAFARVAGIGTRNRGAVEVAARLLEEIDRAAESGTVAPQAGRDPYAARGRRACGPGRSVRTGLA